MDQTTYGDCTHVQSDLLNPWKAESCPWAVGERLGRQTPRSRTSRRRPERFEIISVTRFRRPTTSWTDIAAVTLLVLGSLMIVLPYQREGMIGLPPSCFGCRTSGAPVTRSLSRSSSRPPRSARSLSKRGGRRVRVLRDHPLRLDLASGQAGPGRLRRANAPQSRRIRHLHRGHGQRPPTTCTAKRRRRRVQGEPTCQQVLPMLMMAP
jgi:hypothetical protein